jgi:hypothetical protein
MNPDKLYDKIVRAFNQLKEGVSREIEKTSRGCRLPYIRLAIKELPNLPWAKEPSPASQSYSVIDLEPMEWVGEGQEEFDIALSEKLFQVIADALSPKGTIFLVYRAGPRVDGENGPEGDERHFDKLGRALEYAQSLIQKHFRDKSKRIPFPEVEYVLPARVFDEGPYASSIIIQPIKRS